MEIDTSEIRSLIKRFNNDQVVEQLANYYNSKSFSEIIGVSRKESFHNNFLSWLFNPSETHNLGNKAVRKLLNLLTTEAIGKAIDISRDLEDSIVVDDYKLVDVATYSEKSIGKNGRLDILIEGEIVFSSKPKKFRIIIENKVGSSEHSDQTNKYFSYYKNGDNKDYLNIFTFLTPISSIELTELEEVECNCKEYLQINYQLIAEVILEPLLNTELTKNTRFIINEYLFSLSQPSINEDDDYKQGLVMALGNKERDLLSKFWNKNEKLILASLYAMTTDPNVEKDSRDNFKTTLDQLQGSTRDRSFFNIYYDGNLIHKKIKKSDIGLLTIKTLEANEMIDEQSFEILRKDKSCSFILLKRKSEVTDNEEKYKRYRVNKEPEFNYSGNGYYVARNWGIRNSEKLILKMEEYFPQLEYENIS